MAETQGTNSTQNTNETLPQKKPPLLIFVLLVRFPVVSFLLCMSVYAAVAGVTIYQYKTGVDIFAFDFEQLPLSLNDEIDQRRDLGWKNRNDYPGRLERIIIGRYRPWWIRGYAYDNVELIYKSTRNMLSAEQLGNIADIESELWYLKSYTLNFCQKTYSAGCVKPLSLLRLFDGTYADVDPTFLDPNFTHVPENIYKATVYNETKELVKLLLSADAEVHEHRAYANVIRTRLPIGGPLTIRDGFQKERPRYEAFLENDMQPIIEDIKENNTKDFELFYTTNILFRMDLKKQAFLDLYLAVGSLAFIFVYMLIHTESIWITVWATFSIGMSLILVNIFYRFALGYTYFGFFHILSVFIILGIGADDIFIFFDIWRYNCLQSFQSNAHRLSATYRRAALSMLATSLTTMAAFLVSFMSPLLAVSTFGLYSGLLVAVNYLTVITFFPTVVLVYSLRILPFFHWCISMCRRCSKMDNTMTAPSTETIVPPIMVMTMGPRMENVSFQTAPSRFRYISSLIWQLFIRQDNNTKPRIGHSFLMSLIARFLSTTYYRFVTLKPVKVLVCITFIVLVLTFLGFALRLKPDERQVQMFRTSHNYGQAQYLQSYAFGATSQSDLTRVRLVWGVEEANMANCENKTSKTCKGEAVFDDNFNFGSNETQLAILKVCDRLKNLTDEEVDSLRIRRNIFTNDTEIACFMDALQSYFWDEQDKLDVYQRRLYPENYTFDIPFTSVDLQTLIASKSIYYPFIKSLPAFERPVETAIGYWLSDGWNRSPSLDYFKYKDLIGEEKLPETTAISNIPSLSYNTGLKYIAIEINTTLFANTLGYPEGKPIRNRWEALMQDILKDLPYPLKRGYQTTHDTWHWLRIQETLANSAIFGLSIGLALALPILILTTQNVIIGILATITITFVTICVVGIIPMASWRLGVLESLNLCLVVGLSVDYVVHLAEAYHRCKHKERNERVNHMLETVGSAVLSGAITTGGAAVFMLFAQIQFLVQFGIFLLSTIGFSVLFSLLGFTVLMSICGPRGNTGSLVALFKKCRGSKAKPDNTSCEGHMNGGFVSEQGDNTHSWPEGSSIAHSLGNVSTAKDSIYTSDITTEMLDSDSETNKSNANVTSDSDSGMGASVGTITLTTSESDLCPGTGVDTTSTSVATNEQSSACDRSSETVPRLDTEKINFNSDEDICSPESLVTRL